ncbi:MAG TPA: type III restriction endonuclease subunit R, partial [Bacillota bacterium]|nr:type III restriction endonuclease subunit R [Bacillota bacterium]
MKFQFKIQQYQTDAVNSVVNIFSGQPFSDRVSYVRDLGINKKKQYTQVSLFNEPESPEDELSIGFENARLVLTPGQLLQNIRN